MGGEFDPHRDPGMQTPLAPLPDPDADEAAPRPPAPPGSLRASLKAGLGFVVRAWRPLLAVVVVQLLLAITVVAPFHAGLGQTTVTGIEEAVVSGFQVAMFWVVVLAWVFGAIVAGGLVGTAVNTDLPASIGRFFSLGGRWFGPMLRVGLVFLVAVYVVARLVFELWGGVLLRLQPEAVFVAVVLWLRVVADLARTDLVVYARRGAVAAFVRGIGRTLLHPLRTLGLAALLGVPTLLVLIGLGVISRGLVVETWGTYAVVFLLGQIAVLVRWSSRAALLGAFVYGARVRIAEEAAPE